MATTARPLTVDEFRGLPEDKGAVYYELRHGEVVAVVRPKLKHALVQNNLRELLRQFAEPGSYLDTEVAFRPLPEHELWVADVAYVSAERFRTADPEDNIRGAPDLVIEVLSPSNTAAEMYERERVCLANGARKFRVVDADRRQVKVTTPDGRTVTRQGGDEIPLPFGDRACLNVDDILRF